MLYLMNIKTNQSKIYKKVDNQEVNWYLKESLHLLKSNSGGHFYHLIKIKTPLSHYP